MVYGFSSSKPAACGGAALQYCSFCICQLILTLATCVCRTTQAGLTNVLGALYATTLFFSIINATVIQPVIAAERAVSYRERAAGMYSVFPFTLALVRHFCLYRLHIQICPLLRLLQHLKVVCPCISSVRQAAG